MKMHSNCNLLKEHKIYSKLLNKIYERHVQMSDELRLDELTRILKY